MIFNNHAKVDIFLEIKRYKEIFYIVINFFSNSGFIMSGKTRCWTIPVMRKKQKNTYLPNGHNYQDDRLRIYLPGNGGLLTTIALMCAGWDGCMIDTPGFPKDGNWNVKWEGLAKMP